MRVLWVTNVVPAAASQLQGLPPNPFGGWLRGALGGLSAASDIEVVVAAPVGDTVRPLGVADNTRYVGFPSIGRRVADGQGREIAAQVIADADPDLVHIHGTELPHSLSFALAAEQRSIPTVVSIQGLVSVYARHMAAFLPASVVHGVGPRPWVRSERVIGMQRSFEDQGRLECQTLQLVPHVIGRTAWDRVCTGAINAGRRYYHCDETLRPSFYEEPVERRHAHPRSVLVGQGHYPIKGLHLLLQALPAVVARYPDTVVTVAGQSPLTSRRTPYARYVTRLIDELQLRDNVRFVGPQSEEQMLAHYRKASVLACPSVIENSPNSVAEAMVLGVPVVAAHVGGVPDLLEPGAEGLTYQADAPYMLADALVSVFDDPDRAADMATRARERARQRHDPATNARRTLEIYAEILAEVSPR